MNKDVNLGRIDMIWEVLYNSYVKNFDKFDEYESEYLMKNFNKAYIRFKEIAYNSDYSNNEYVINNGNQKCIDNMKELAKKVDDFHHQHYEQIDDDNNIIIENVNINIEPNSVLNINNLIDTENEFIEIFNEINGNDYIKEDASINEDGLNNEKMIKKLNYLNKILQELNISKENEYIIKEKLLKLYKKFNEQKRLIEKYNIIHNIENTEKEALIYNIRNGLLIKLLSTYPNDIEINNEILESENKIKTSNIRKTSFFENFSNLLGFAILAAGDENGNLAKELDENGNLVPIKIKVMINREEQEISIDKLIPSLKNLKGKELEKNLVNYMKWP